MVCNELEIEKKKSFTVDNLKIVVIKFFDTKVIIIYIYSAIEISLDMGRSDSSLYQLSRAAVIKCHKLGDSNAKFIFTLLDTESSELRCW